MMIGFEVVTAALLSGFALALTIVAFLVGIALVVVPILWLITLLPDRWFTALKDDEDDGGPL